MLSGMGHQLAAEQAMRRADGQAFDANLKNVEAAMAAAQEGVVNRTVSMIEAKAQGFIKAIKELDVRGGGGGGKGEWRERGPLLGARHE